MIATRQGGYLCWAGKLGHCFLQSVNLFPAECLVSGVSWHPHSTCRCVILPLCIITHTFYVYVFSSILKQWYLRWSHGRKIHLITVALKHEYPWLEIVASLRVHRWPLWNVHEAFITTSDDTPTTSSSFKIYVCYLEAFREIVIFPVSSEVYVHCGSPWNDSLRGPKRYFFFFLTVFSFFCLTLKFNFKSCFMGNCSQCPHLLML